MSIACSIDIYTQQRSTINRFKTYDARVCLCGAQKQLLRCRWYLMKAYAIWLLAEWLRAVFAWLLALQETRNAIQSKMNCPPFRIIDNRPPPQFYKHIYRALIPSYILTSTNAIRMTSPHPPLLPPPPTTHTSPPSIPIHPTHPHAARYSIQPPPIWVMSSLSQLARVAIHWTR